MDTKGRQVRQEKGRGWFATSLMVMLLVSCGRSGSAVAPPPAPAPPAIIEEEALPANLAEARAMRRAARLDLYERGLRRMAESEDPVAARRAASLLALHLFDQRRLDEAVPALQAAAARSPLVAPFLQLRLIEAELGRENVAGGIAAAEEVITGAPATTAATVARLRLPALHAAAGNEAAAEATFQTAMKVEIDESSERELVELASLLAQHGRDDLATRLRMRLLRDYTGGRETERTYGHLVAMADSPIDALSLEEATRLAQSLARANRYDQALDLLERIRKRFPQSAQSELYRSVRLRSLFNSRNYAQLLAETERVSLSDPALLLLRARAAWRDDRPQQFLAGLAAVERRFPGSRQAVEAKILRAKYYVTDVMDYAKSVANLEQAIQAGAAGNDGENVWTLGWTYVLWGKDDEALRTFARYLRTYPDGDYRTNSLFWSAKVHERNERIAERDASLRQLISEYPYNYYAYRAREILGEPSVAPGSMANGNVFPDIDAELAAVPSGRLESVRELLALELGRDAAREMKAVAAAHRDNLGAAFLLADVYVQGAEPFRATGILQRHFRQFVRHGGENVPRRFWEILYPLSYWEAIEREAQRRELDPYLLAAIIRQESGFEPTVVSSAGAVGLMQIMPNEAPRIASIAGLDAITREQLFDPHENIAVGAAEYSQKLSRMRANPILAIAAYNAGEEAVGRWIARTPIGDPDLFVESISYAETRLYVKTVTRNRFEYRRIYEMSHESQQSQ
ncbi:MAG TPA: transglycosylase SLT domain-containing protein [Thermoanaerobaculia bacterium]|nr:transglycosylase SLT domain-containing protein [Thermoanaerobaculia bacterium]